MCDYVRGSVIESPDPSWDTFVHSHPQASIFHLADWSNLLAECYGYRPFVLTVQNQVGKIQAGLPLMDIRSSLTGHRWVCLPFTDYCAPLYRDIISRDQLLSELVRQFHNSHVPRIEVRWQLPQPFVNSRTKYVRHVLELNNEAAQTYSLIHRTQRQNIRTAEKNGVQVVWSDNLSHMRTFYALHCLTRRRHGIPVQPWKFFQLTFSNIIEKGLGFILLAYYDEHCIAAGLFLHWNQTLMYKYAASNDEGLRLRANHLITWTAIRWACDQGYKKFDFGRSDLTNEGLRTFKNRWGAEEIPLTYSILSSHNESKLLTGMMKFIEKVIQASPVWFCRVTGELLYKHYA